MKKSVLKAIVVISLVLTSCIKDDLEKLQKTNWEPEFAFSLVNTRFEIDRIIKKFETSGFLTSDSQDVITVVYNGQVFSVMADKLFSFDDFTIPLAQAQQAGGIPVSQGNYLLKSIDFDQCNLLVEVEDDVAEDIRVTLNMPKTTLNSVPFSKTFIVKYKGGSALAGDTFFDLGKYHMDLTDQSGTRNRLSMNYTAVKVSDGTPVTLNQIDVTFRNISFLYFDGYLGKFKLGEHLDSIRISMFENFKSGSITLEDPKFRLDIFNSFGIPVHLSFGNFSGSGQGGSSALTGDAITNGVDVNSPSAGGQSAETHKQIDTSNSNISDFLTLSPNSLKFSFNLDANSNNDTNAVNFVRKTSELKCDLALNIPMKGSFDSVIIEDIYEFKSQNLENVNSATFKLATNNAFPLGIYVQIYFLDKSLHVLDSLMQDNSTIFKEAVADANGFSIAPSYEESYFTIGLERFGTIREKAKNLKIKVMLNTHEAKKRSIKITDRDYFDIRLAMRAELKL